MGERGPGRGCRPPRGFPLNSRAAAAPLPPTAARGVGEADGAGDAPAALPAVRGVLQPRRSPLRSPPPPPQDAPSEESSIKPTAPGWPGLRAQRAAPRRTEPRGRGGVPGARAVLEREPPRPAVNKFWIKQIELPFIPHRGNGVGLSAEPEPLNRPHHPLNCQKVTGT